jgi:hypothetical protein
MENAPTQTTDPEPFLRREGDPDFLAQALQARQKQWRTKALANRQRQKQVDGLAVVELKSPEPSANRHPYTAAPSSLGFDGYAARSKARHVPAQGAQADAQLRGKRTTRRTLVGGKQAQQPVQSLASGFAGHALQRCQILALFRPTLKATKSGSPRRRRTS